MCAAGGPFLDDEVLAHIQASRRERDVRPCREDARDVLTNLAPLRTLTRGVILEDHVGSVHRDDRVDVVLVPGPVVAVERDLALVIEQVRHHPDHA